jgi:pilus assembly protein CpaF
MEENIISMHEIFSFDKKGIGPDGRVMGVFQPSRIRPKFLEQLRISGVMLPASMFEHAQEVN